MHSFKLFASAAALAASTLIITPAALAVSNTSWKFDFGSGPVESGYTQVTASTLYNNTAGYGFASTSGLSSVNRSAPDSLRGDYITGTSAFKFSANVPTGNYNVTVITGDNSGTSETSFKSEVERIVAQQVKTTSGQFSTYTFTVHIKSDAVLDLTFYGAAPKVNAIEIQKTTTAITAFIAGDSTVCDQNSIAYAGWGQEFTAYLKQGVAVANFADSGESSTSFWNGFYVPNIQNKIKSGDYLFIQFGHNDEKSLTLAQYKTGLKRYVDDAKAKGAYPILVTPLERNIWSGGVLGHSHGDFPATMKQLATETGTPCIDLTTKSWELYNSMGQTNSATLFVSGDKTHTNETGAVRIAGLIRDGVRELSISPLASYLIGAAVVDPPLAGNNYEAESAVLAGGVTVESSSGGFNGSGYINFPANSGTATFNNVAGNGGGVKGIGFRYALAGTASRAGTLTVNGVSSSITFPATGGLSTWSVLRVDVTLGNNNTNTIRLASTGADLANVDYLNIPPVSNAADVYQAEAATFGGTTAPVSETTHTGYNGSGYVNFQTNTSTLTFSDVNPNGGGTKALTIRYALGASAARSGNLTVNGVTTTVTFQPTGGWTTWSTLTVNITLSATGTNSIQLASTGSDLANIDEISIPW